MARSSLHLPRFQVALDHLGENAHQARLKAVDKTEFKNLLTKERVDLSTLL